jgi:hypothetical protein
MPNTPLDDLPRHSRALYFDVEMTCWRDHLALAAMGLLDAMKKTQEWSDDEASCRDRVEQSAAAIARVIGPLCLSLPKKLPKPAYA